MTAGSPHQGFRNATLFCNFCIFGLSVFGLLRGVVSLVLSIVVLVLSGVGFWGVYQNKPFIGKINYGTYAAWIAIYILLIILSFVWGDLTAAGINVAFAVFGVLGGWCNHNYVQSLQGGTSSSMV